MWVELQLLGLARDRLDEASHALFALGCAGLQEDHLPGQAPRPRQPWDTGPEAPPAPRLLLRAWFERPDRPAIEAALSPLGVQPAWVDVPEVDWATAWRERFHPVVISPRLVIAPPWDAPAGSLIIEPGQGFGTGHHPTTVQALRAVDELADALSTCLDIGCGSGVLALAAARRGLQATGVDVEAPAIEDAKRNAQRNGLQASFSTAPVHTLEHTADLVLANLHAELLVRLAPHILRLTHDHLVLAGILEDREAMVLEAFTSLPLVQRDQQGPWVCLRYRREA